MEEMEIPPDPIPDLNTQDLLTEGQSIAITRVGDVWLFRLYDVDPDPDNPDVGPDVVGQPIPITDIMGTRLFGNFGESFFETLNKMKFILGKYKESKANASEGQSDAKDSDEWPELILDPDRGTNKR